MPVVGAGGAATRQRWSSCSSRPEGQPLGRRRAALVAVAGVTLVLVPTGTGLAVDRVDAAHPRRADLAYLLDADTGRATWLSRDAEPAEWARRYVTERSADPERAAGLADGPVWLGPAPAVRAPAPEVTLRSRQGDTIELHVFSPRSAATVVLRVDHRVDEVTVTASRLTPTGITLKGILPGRWPTEVRFGDLPAEGIDITLRVPHQGPLRIAAYDLTPGLAEVPAQSRPITLETSSTTGMSDVWAWSDAAFKASTSRWRSSSPRTRLPTSTPSGFSESRVVSRVVGSVRTMIVQPFKALIRTPSLPGGPIDSAENSSSSSTYLSWLTAQVPSYGRGRMRRAAVTRTSATPGRAAHDENRLPARRAPTMLHLTTAGARCAGPKRLGTAGGR